MGDPTPDKSLGLPNLRGSWLDPYDDNPYCAKPIMLVISDIYPSYDSDQLPGVDSDFGTWSAAALGNRTLNVKTLANTISTTEGVNGTFFIGQVGSDTDLSCSDKVVDSLGNIRGLCPEEPTKQGSYYSASVAYYGKTTDINTGESDRQTVDTYAVALSSPLPEIVIPIGDRTVSLVPIGKTVGHDSGDVFYPGYDKEYTPSSTIADFYVESINATYGKFRINFEVAEYGNDHDMDAVTFYEYSVDEGTGEVSITLETEYGSASNIIHMGYIISGTENDGVYLDVANIYNNIHNKDVNATSDPTVGDDVDHPLDTPPGQYHPGTITWADNQPLPQSVTRTFSPSSNPPASLLKNPLYYAAKWGGFEDSDGDGVPDQQGEWDKDGDGVPDNYFFVANPTKLESQLNKAFAGILKRLSSGAAASVISGSRSGAGALYQAVFWPSAFDEAGNEVTWFGDVHGLFISPDGKLYEDTDGNGLLDTDSDDSVVFYYDGTRAKACVGGSMSNGTCVGGTATELEDINYLWSAGEWLGRSSLVPLTQRSYSPSLGSNNHRFVFTWFDTDSDGAVDGTSIGSGELLPFTTSAIGATNATNLVADKTIEWLRGYDLYSDLRSREYVKDGVTTYKRLGDVIHSTPVAVGTPAENYDLYWRDFTYSAFYRKYKKRRQVVYFGGNDGMLHAVNAGFFNPSETKFYKHYNPDTGDYSNDQGLDLGAELWAYVPYNLLPHLDCLTNPEYEHKYYVDLHPRVFDVRIFPNSTTHPNGWGTIMVCGMRFGGGYVHADGRDFASSYMIFDITDPESEPRLLGEVTYDYDDNSKVKLGYTMSVPSVVPTENGGGTQKWFLMLGSGPDAGDISLTNAASTQKARIAMIPLNTLVSDNLSLRIPDVAPTETTIGRQEHPEQDSYVGTEFVSVDYDLDFKSDLFYYGLVQGPDNKDVWGGTMYRLRVEPKQNSNNLADPSGWSQKKVIDTGKPITGGPNVGFYQGDAWVYFGTGRFLTADDSRDTEDQYFFGIREPKTSDGGYNYNTLSVNYSNPGTSWVDATDILVDVDTGDLSCVGGGTDCLPDNGAVDTFGKLHDYIEDTADNGWFRKLTASGERVVGQPTLLGGLVNYTSYIPSTDPCYGEGQSRLYALYYLTGTAWTENVFGETDAEYITFMKELGQGLALTPTLHIGTEKGARVILQTSTGEIINIHQPNLPLGNFKSGKAGWHSHELP